MIAILLLVAAFLFMAMLMPLKFTIAVVAMTLVIGFVVKIVARTVTGEEPTVAEALKAVLVAILFDAIASAALAKLAGKPIEGLSAVAASVVTFLAFSMGFVVMLKATLKQSALIALLSTPIAGLIIFGATRL